MMRSRLAWMTLLLLTPYLPTAAQDPPSDPWHTAFVDRNEIVRLLKDFVPPGATALSQGSSTGHSGGFTESRRRLTGSVQVSLDSQQMEQLLTGVRDAIERELGEENGVTVRRTAPESGESLALARGFSLSWKRGSLLEGQLVCTVEAVEATEDEGWQQKVLIEVKETVYARLGGRAGLRLQPTWLLLASFAMASIIVGLGYGLLRRKRRAA